MSYEPISMKIPDEMIYILILNWNNYSRTIDCIKSCLSHLKGDLTYIICDNGSSDDSVNELRKFLADNSYEDESNITSDVSLSPKCKIIKFKRFEAGNVEVREERYPVFILVDIGDNLGYSGGNNVGLKYALSEKAEYVLILNNDIIITDDIICTLYNTALIDKEIGIVGAVNYDMNDSTHVIEAGITFNRLLTKGTTLNVKASGYDYADKVIGSSLFVKCEALKKVGLLDEEYFLYYEDTDLCLRFKKKGYKILVSYDAKILHSTEGSSNTAVKSYYHARNSFLLFKKHLPPQYRWVSILILVSKRVKSLFGYIIKRHDYSGAKYAMLGIYDGIRGKFGVGRCGYILQKGNKNYHS